MQLSSSSDSFLNVSVLIKEFAHIIFKFGKHAIFSQSDSTWKINMGFRLPFIYVSKVFLSYEN